ncbi:GATA zinc finger domain-containing protein 14-like isoform X1 [Bactrocera neohumeralis]|uniref:GATA zinc finger domain-containing protein 14-like isoform X1 n=1 Tax=Bactrocera neohumeralis TaxID=98809 RepID=UPI0021660F88|nr:GATA zinc finger domain-containing protein 14-like isoform X1 [Bactrocera neohumeralis]XP_050332106.1 GATA zinc finger domain-containing protein 14-like isoform X1 [Bactrocera neohumeralis]XP_050332107.1 GATA zinc finger domain-containing protein 14-like isoform X1 [Bactrocera neohumeralis]
MPTIYQLSAVVRILILLALCGLSNAQMLDVDDFCDFAGYDGICLEASKCTDLQAKMQALTLESHHVGRCGFGVREEIICCPKWQTPVQTPPKLPNAFIDLSKQPEFEYKPPLDGALSDSSILSTTSTPINFQQNGNNFQEHVQDEEDRLKLLFNGNFGQAGNGNNVREWKGDSAPAVNENNNGFFIANPVPNVQDNQNLNGNPVVEENERFNAIFGNGNDNSPDEKKANSFPVVNENNNGFFIANPVANVQGNQLNGYPVIDENDRLNAIFGDNSAQNGNENSQDEKKVNSFPVVNENSNGFFIANPVPNVQDNQNLNGNPAVDENERMNAIFGNNHEQIGNDNSQDEKKANSFPVVNENNNGFFSGNPVANVQDNQNFNGNPVVDENERINAIFSVNPEQIGNDNSQDEKKVNSFPVVNENNNGFFIANPLPNVQDNQLNGYPVIDENDRLNAIFGDNSAQNGNENSQDEKKVNSFPVVNENNNRFLIANPVANLQNNQNLNGNPAVDENERMNAIFGNNLEHNRNDESKEETKTNPVPFVNGNNNGFFSATPVPNVQGNGEFIGNPVVDANESVKAVFDNNPVHVGSDNSKDEGKVNPLLLVNGNNNGIFNQNPIPNVEGNQKLNGNPVIDENERFNALFNPLPIDDDRVRPSGVIDQDSAENLKAKINAIFGGNREQVGNANDNEESKGNPVPVINGNNNAIFNQNPISSVQNNQKLNGNPFSTRMKDLKRYSMATLVKVEV